MKSRFIVMILAFTLVFNRTNVNAGAKDTEEILLYKTESVVKNRTVSAKNKEKAAALLMSAWDSYKSKCDLSKYNIPSDQFGDFLSSILKQYPRYFYVTQKNCKYYINSKGYVLYVECKYKYSKSKIKSKLSKYDAAIAKALDGINSVWSDMEKALYFNDYLAANCEYDTTYSKYTAFDALVKGKAVCAGYSFAYIELMSQVGIPCKIVSSKSLNHAWNMVYINNKYYFVDVTWNDPVGNSFVSSRHKYFLKSRAFFRSKKGKHLAKNDWTVDGGWKVNAANDKSYDNYFWNSIDTCFEYIDGFWYNFDGNNNIAKYTYSKKNFKYVENTITIDDVWYIQGKDGWFYKDKYVGTDSYNNKFYYSTADKIYQLDVKTKKSKVVYELPKNKKNSGNIWSIYINKSGKLYYYWSADYKSAKKTFALNL